MENHEMPKGKTCSCAHHKVVPIVLILIGVDFLLGALSVFTGWFVNLTWPILLIIAGSTKLGGCKCC